MYDVVCQLVLYPILYIIHLFHMTLDIITPDRKVYSGEATAVTFPGSEGQFQVLNDHAPLVSTLGQGPIVVQTDTGQQIFTVDGGVVEVLQNSVLVLAESVVV